MTRLLRVAGAQMGPIARDEPRQSAVTRMLALLERAAGMGCRLIVFPELALTTFFPRWWFEDEGELDAFYESEMPNAATAPLFEAAAKHGIAFCLGYAELALEHGRKRRFNTAILVDGSGAIAGRYHKVHLPGHADNQPWRPFQHLEKAYFEPGDLGFPVFEVQGARIGMCICNDRRWPETYRVLALNGAEVIVLGYNTPTHFAEMPSHDHLQGFHNHLCMQAGAYQNGCFVVGVAKAGREEGADLLGQSAIIAPTGEIVAQATGVGDELIVSDCDLDRCQDIRNHVFSFARHRRPECYGPITAPH